MAPVLSIVTGVAAFALFALPAVHATSMTTWSGTSCNSGDVLNWSGHSDSCRSLGELDLGHFSTLRLLTRDIANVRSLIVHDIDPGCSGEFKG